MSQTEHHRRSIRLKGYDYTSPGAYFVTICTQNRACLFWDDRIDKIVLSPMGLIAKRAWLDLPHHYPHAQLDAFCIMPNHVHGIIVLKCEEEFPRRGGSVLHLDTSPDQKIPGLNLLSNQSQTRPYPPDTTPDQINPDQSQTRPYGIEPPHGPSQTRPYGNGMNVRHGLPEIIRAFKSFSARRINAARQTPGVSVWQRNYYEHIIRNQDEWRRIRDYILENPHNWGVDSQHISKIP